MDAGLLKLFDTVIPISKIQEFKTYTEDIPVYNGPEINPDISYLSKIKKVLGLFNLRKVYADLYVEENWKLKKFKVLFISLEGRECPVRLYDNEIIKEEIDYTFKASEGYEENVNFLYDGGPVVDRLKKLNEFDYFTDYTPHSIQDMYSKIYKYYV